MLPSNYISAYMSRFFHENLENKNRIVGWYDDEILLWTKKLMFSAWAKYSHLIEILNSVLQILINNTFRLDVDVAYM